MVSPGDFGRSLAEHRLKRAVGHGIMLRVDGVERGHLKVRGRHIFDVIDNPCVAEGVGFNSYWSPLRKYLALSILSTAGFPFEI